MPISPEQKKVAEKIECETRDNIARIVQIEKEHRENRTLSEKASEWISTFAGSMFFVYLHIAFFTGWIVANVVSKDPIDPFPFTFLTLVVSLEAIFLSTFILISQNQEKVLTDRRNHLELQVNLLAEQENTKMLELLKAIAERLDVDVDHEAMDALLKPVEPEKIVKEIQAASDGELDEIVKAPEKVEGSGIPTQAGAN